MSSFVLEYALSNVRIFFFAYGYLVKHGSTMIFIKERYILCIPFPRLIWNMLLVQ